MLGMGWQEIFLVAVVAIIVVGPKELPRVLRTVSYWISKFRDMAREFQSGVEDVVREAELEDLRKELEESTKADMATLTGAIDPGDDVAETVRSLENSILTSPEENSKVDEGHTEENTKVPNEAVETDKRKKLCDQNDGLENTTNNLSDKLV